MKHVRNEKGQSLIEYIILVALVVLVSVTATKSLGRAVNTKFKEIKDKIESSIDVRLSP